MDRIIQIEHDIMIYQSKLLEKQRELQQLRGSLELTPSSSDSELNNDEIYRYSRQMIIPEIGVKGQLNLKNCSYLIVGAGALGCPALIYLSRAGVKRIGIIDYDTVDKNNLHRQILYTENSIGQPKSTIAKNVLLEINPAAEIEDFNYQITSTNAIDIIKKYNVVLDCSDNIATRYLLNDACVIAKKPLVSGSALRMEGQLTVYNYNNGPCYRCLFPKPPSPETVTNCSEGGILGAITGVIGSLEALEGIKIALGYKDILSGRMLIFDGSQSNFRNIVLRPKNSKCVVCSDTPTITKLIDYEEFCGMKASDKDFSLTLLQEHERITVDEYLQMTEDKIKHILIDVRNPVEYEFGHLDNARNIPLKEILKDTFLDEIKQNIDAKSEILLVCRRGNDSQLAVQHLKTKLNKQPKDIIGGLHEWHKRINMQFPTY